MILGTAKLPTKPHLHLLFSPLAVTQLKESHISNYLMFTSPMISDGTCMSMLCVQRLYQDCIFLS